MGAVFKVLLVAVLGAFTHKGLKTLHRLGMFSHHFRRYPGPCQVVEGIQPGSEDFETLSSGQTFISSGLRYKHQGPKNVEFWKSRGVEGRIYLLDLNKVNAGLKSLKLTSTPNFDSKLFSPHGLSVWEDKKEGRHVLFVVNHPFTETVTSRIEKFVYDPKTQGLTHLASFEDASMHGVNDVQATGENSFYFTNSNYFTNPHLAPLEVVLELPLTDVVYFDGQSYTVVDSGLRQPNGVLMSPDGKFLYVSYFASGEVAVYTRRSDNSLSRVQVHAVHNWPDNLQIDHASGHLYVAIHPSMSAFAAYFGDLGRTSPSQVLELAVKDGLIVDAQELLYDDGDLISGSSTAIVYNRTLLVSSVFNTLVTCKVKVPLL